MEFSRKEILTMRLSCELAMGRMLDIISDSVNGVAEHPPCIVKNASNVVAQLECIIDKLNEIL